MLLAYKKIDVYHFVIVFLAVAGLSTVYITKNSAFLTQLVVVPVAAAALDFAINYAKTKKFSRPTTAAISGLIAALVLPSLPASALAAAAAIASKHIIKWKGRNIFNPAAIGIVLASLLFSLDTAWWVSVSMLVLLGFLVVQKLGRLRTTAAFLAVYFLLVYLTTRQLQPDLTAVFFATIMLIEPKTSPHTKKGMIVFGAAAALLVIALPFLLPGRDPFLISLLVMNLFTGLINRKVK